MERKRYAREFKLEAVRLVKERGVSVAQASRDLGVHANVLREWVRAFAADPEQAFPGRGQMKPDQLEVERLRREVQKLKAERDILKKARKDEEVDEAPRDMASAVDVRGARCLAGWLLCLADTAPQPAKPGR